MATLGQPAVCVKDVKAVPSSSEVCEKKVDETLLTRTQGDTMATDCIPQLAVKFDA
jgi:hypothetical protein